MENCKVFPSFLLLLFYSFSFAFFSFFSTFPHSFSGVSFIFLCKNWRLSKKTWTWNVLENVPARWSPVLDRAGAKKWKTFTYNSWVGKQKICTIGKGAENLSPFLLFSNRSKDQQQQKSANNENSSNNNKNKNFK